MAIIKEEIVGTKIICEIKSSNLSNAEYDTESKKLTITFNNGTQYLYEDVSHESFTKFRLSPSQGSYFSKEISKKHKYKKL